MGSSMWLLIGGGALLYLASQAKARRQFIERGFGISKEKAVEIMKEINQTATPGQNKRALEFLRDRATNKGSVAALTVKDIKDAIDEVTTAEQWERIYMIAPELKEKFAPGVPLPFDYKLPAQVIEYIKDALRSVQEGSEPLGGVGAAVLPVAQLFAKLATLAVPVPT